MPDKAPNKRVTGMASKPIVPELPGHEIFKGRRSRRRCGFTAAICTSRGTICSSCLCS